MQALLKNSKVIAIVGLSPLPSKPSFQVASYLKDRGYQIIPIYPKRIQILGIKAYTSIDQIQEKVDIFVIFRSSQKCLEVVQEILSSHQPKAIWLQLGIFNHEAQKLAESKNIQFIQDRCIKIEREKYD